jgi:hypothetical protein
MDYPLAASGRGHDGVGKVFRLRQSAQPRQAQFQ